MKNILLPKHNERGQSMVELALTVSILMVLLAGTIDLGRAFFTWLAMRDAAQEGASYGSYTASDTAGIEARARANFSDVINDPAALVTVHVDYSGDLCLDPNLPPPNVNTLTVNIDYDNFPITMPFLGTLLGSQTLPIHAAVSDTILSPLCGP